MLLRVLVLGTVLLAGCNNNKALIDEAAGFESRACACKDAACTDGVVKDVKTWSDRFKDRRGTQDEINTVDRHFLRMGECMAKAGMSEASEKMLMDMGAEAERL